MNYPRLVIASLLLLCSQLTFADTIQTYWITDVYMEVQPGEVGFANPLYYDFSGPHFSLLGFGGLDCSYCHTDGMYDGEGFTAIQAYYEAFYSDFVIDGVRYPGEAVTFTSSLFADHDGIPNPLVTGTLLLADGTTRGFILKVPTHGFWNASYGYSSPDGDNPGYYYFLGAGFDASQSVPEPGSMLLLGSGLIGIGTLARRRLSGILCRPEEHGGWPRSHKATT